jgi:formylglycine-generating enzyme required for sulfatase activity
VLLRLALYLSTLPVAAQDAPRLSIERSADSSGTVHMSFAAAPGTVYRLQESRDLSIWQVRRTGVAAAEGVSIAIPTAEAASSFFRVTLIPIQPLASMVWIAPGEFVMGSPPDEVGRFLDKEETQTRVTLTRGYWISRYVK